MEPLAGGSAQSMTALKCQPGKFTSVTTHNTNQVCNVIKHIECQCYITFPTNPLFSMQTSTFQECCSCSIRERFHGANALKDGALSFLLFFLYAVTHTSSTAVVNLLFISRQ